MPIKGQSRQMIHNITMLGLLFASLLAFSARADIMFANDFAEMDAEWDMETPHVKPRSVQAVGHPTAAPPSPPPMYGHYGGGPATQPTAPPPSPSPPSPAPPSPGPPSPEPPSPTPPSAPSPPGPPGPPGPPAPPNPPGPLAPPSPPRPPSPPSPPTYGPIEPPSPSPAPPLVTEDPPPSGMPPASPDPYTPPAPVVDTPPTPPSYSPVGPTAPPPFAGPPAPPSPYDQPPPMAGPPAPSPPSPSPAVDTQPSVPPPIYAPPASPEPFTPPPTTASPPSYPPLELPPSPPRSPPPPGVNRLPPSEVSLVTASANSAAPESNSTTGMGLVRIRTLGDEAWSYVCGDPWAGWDAGAASAFCRQAGFTAGGEALRIWRSGTQPPILLGKLLCAGTETTLTNCLITGAPGKIDYWQLGIDVTVDTSYAGVCQMLAAVRCRTHASTINLRAASSPAPVNTVSGGHTVRLIRLEASVAGGPYGAVCADGGFDNAAAAVACRALNYTNGGFFYAAGAPTGTPNTDTVTLESTLDAQGNYLGTVSNVVCTGSETSMTSCSAWRTSDSSSVVPCRAAAWAACRTSATI